MAAVDLSDSGLSQRGERSVNGIAQLGPYLELIKDSWDEQSNPGGIVFAGLAENQLMRKPLLDYLNSNKLVLSAKDMTYADRIHTSMKFLTTLANFFNSKPYGVPDTNGKLVQPAKPITPIKPEHIVCGSGATGILASLAWVLCDVKEGIILSVPTYNAFVGDFTAHAEATVVKVNVSPAHDISVEEHVAAYEAAIQQAQKEGIKVRVLCLCNPHNPTGAIYTREVVVALAKFAAKHDLHLLSDEIYARSCFRSKIVPSPPQFVSILDIDLEKEAGLKPSRVHIVTAASKDFALNGFRIGIVISQHNPMLLKAVQAESMFQQVASPAAALLGAMLDDGPFIDWFISQVTLRLGMAFNYVSAFLQHHQIPFGQSNSGHTLLVDLRRFSSTQPVTPEIEKELRNRLIERKVAVAPGAQYLHPEPGWVRLTFSLDPPALKTALIRFEETFGLDKWIEGQQDLVFDDEVPRAK